MKHKLVPTAIAIGLLEACVSAQSTGQATGAVAGVVFRRMQMAGMLSGMLSYPPHKSRWTAQHTLRLRVIALASSHSMQFLVGRTRLMQKHPAWPQIGRSRLWRALLQKWRWK